MARFEKEKRNFTTISNKNETFFTCVTLSKKTQSVFEQFITFIYMILFVFVFIEILFSKLTECSE